MTILLFSQFSFAKKEDVKATSETCESLNEKLELEQYNFHDTLSLMMTDLREASTPDGRLDQKKIAKYLEKLETRKKAMKKVTSHKLYTKCFY